MWSSLIRVRTIIPGVSVKRTARSEDGDDGDVERLEAGPGSAGGGTEGSSAQT